MKQFSVLAAIALLTSLCTAVPLRKRSVVWVTDIVEVIDTVVVVKTVWIDGPGAPTGVSAAAVPAISTTAEHKPHKSHKSKKHHEPKTTQSALAPAPAPAAPSSQAPVPAPAPAAPSSQAPTSAPAPSSAAPAPAPSSAAPAPAPVPAPAVSSAAPAPAPAPAVSSSAPAAAPAPVSSSPAVVPAAASNPSGTTYSGDITYYAPGLGSCGWTSAPTDYIVALSTLFMKNGPNPNDNPLCGKMITISYGGKQAQARVVDTCVGCDYDSIDLTPTLFEEFAPLSTGRVSNVEWWFS